MDCRMPGAGGVAATREIVKGAPGTSRPGRAVQKV